MFKNKDLQLCKAIAHVCKFSTEMLDGKHKYDIYTYSLGKTKLPEIMCGNFDGGTKLTDEEQKSKIKSYEKEFGGAVKRHNELNNTNNDELANTAIEYHNIS